jgi:aminoglycoside phosphotransferase (APT) family kinase protein
MSAATAFALPEIEDKSYPLEAALDSTYMEEILTPLARARFGQGAYIARVSTEVLRRRNHRCVLRYCIHAVDTCSGKKLAWRVIGKVVRVEVGEKLFNHMRLLWKNGFARYAADDISMPEPLDFMPEAGLLVQEEVPGQPLKELMKQSMAQPEHFRQLARTLMKLHRCSIFSQQLSRVRVREHLLRCHPKHEFLALACPGLAPAIEFIVDGAHHIENSCGDFQPTLLHGDFHLGQVHLLNQRSWLLDFDALGYGDPASDLGNFLVFMKSKAKKNSQVQLLLDAFLDEYFSRMDAGIAARIPLYEGLTHLRRACKCLRLQEEGWQEKVRRMVEQGIESIQEMASKCWLSPAPATGGQANGRNHRIR